MNKVFRFGVVGCGGQGTGHVHSLVKRSEADNIKVVAISDVYQPGGYIGGPQRNRTIEAWGQLVGRNRAVRELDQAVLRQALRFHGERCPDLALAVRREPGRGVKVVPFNKGIA